MEKFDKFVADKRAMADIQDQVVTVFIVLILAATIGAISLGMIANASTANWNTSTIVVWSVLGVIAIVVVLLLLLKLVRRGGK